MSDINDRIMRELHHQFKKFDDMSLSANIYSKNLVWQKVKGFKEQIALIDFDIIYSGITALSALDFSLSVESIRNKKE